jgi:rare lipoprotein A
MRALFAVVSVLALVALAIPQLAAGPGSLGHLRGSTPRPVGAMAGGSGPQSPVAAAADVAPRHVAPRPSPEHTETCTASWFGAELRGAVQASGIPFDPDELVAAMWDVPFGTELSVVEPVTGRSVVVTVTDRGPAHRLGRCIDLSTAAFTRLADPDVGLIEVAVAPMDDQEHNHGHARGRH